jgi:hypothetical protein
MEKLVENTLEDDPIEKSTSCAWHGSPLASNHSEGEPQAKTVTCEPQCQRTGLGAGYGRGGRGGNANPEVVVHDDRHHHEEFFVASFSADGESASLI